MKKYTLTELNNLFDHSEDHRLVIDQLTMETFSKFKTIEVLDSHEDAIYILKDDQSIMMGWYGPDVGIDAWFKIRDNIYQELGLLTYHRGDDGEILHYTFKGYKQKDLTMCVSEFITKVDSDELIIVRPLLGTLDHALAKSVLVSNISDIKQVIGANYCMCDLSHSLRIEKYGPYDTRCGWETHIVFLGDSPMLYISGSAGE